MAGDGGKAFARLFSQRRDELDLSVVDIAVRTGRPIEVVVGWEQGRAVPDADDVVKVAATLKLPKPLLQEALRRVAEYRTSAPLDPGPEASQDYDDNPDAAVASADKVATARTSTGTYQPPARQPISFSFSAMLTRVQQALRRRRRLARAPIAHPSYLEDREQLITYRLRMVFTAAGVAALALILRWSLGGLGSAISDLWKALTGAL